MGQVSDTVAEMDNSTQNNAATAEEAASASDDLSRQAVRLDSMVDELTKLVGKSRIKRRLVRPHSEKVEHARRKLEPRLLTNLLSTSRP